MTTPDSTPPATPFHFGAAWQPEHWPEDQWVLDVGRMRDLGITCVRLFDFAWHRFEPREWEFDFDWAVRVLDLLREAGINAIIATPTAAPPAWMAAKYPEILRVGPDGRRASVGRARQYSMVSSRYREFCSRVVDQMVHAFRGHEAIVGWQVDNQMSGADYGNEARRTFHSWLHDRFGLLESLNKTWGLEGGSQAYEYFEQIPVPQIDDVGHRPIPAAVRHHPSLMVAFQRFVNDQWSSFIQTQCEVIRAGFDKPLTTNMTPDWGMNYFRQNQLLDRVAMSLSPESDLSTCLMHLDRMRAEKPGVPYGVLGAPLEGRQATAFVWLAALMGGEAFVFEHWRQPWAGQEMGQSAPVAPNGRWNPSKAIVGTLATGLKAQADYLGNRPPVEARVGVVMSNESAWAFSIEPPEPDFEYERVWREEFYFPVVRSHYWRDVIDQNADFCPYHVLIAPLVPMLFRPTKDRLKEWVEGGGCLLLGPLTGHRSEEFTAWTAEEFGGLEGLIGGTCSSSLRASELDDATLTWGDGTAAEAEAPGDLLTSTPRGLCHAFTATAARVLARYADTGEAAILMNKVGQGTVITLGARVDQDSYLDLVHTLCELAKVEPLASGSGDVAVIPRMNPDTSIAAYGLVNLTADARTITLAKGGRDRLRDREVSGEVTLEPYEVLLVEVAPAEAGAVETPAAQPAQEGAST